MSRFDKYFLMEEDDVIEYIKEKHDYFAKDDVITCKEIGDGNLNYVFHLKNQDGKSIIVKHSGVETRAKSGRLISLDRNRKEAEIMINQDKLAPGLVPKVFVHDNTMACYLMEDLSAYKILRTAMLNFETCPVYAEQVAEYMVRIGLPTTDIAMNHKEKKGEVVKFINDDLCQISEQLVYSEAVLNTSGKNSCTEENVEFVNKEVYGDKALALETAKLKFEFMEHAQALIHGDLHSGSVFARKDQIKVFDPEFTFYGPMGYDLGNVIAHLIFALMYSEATNTVNKEEFKAWAYESIEKTIDLYIEKFKALYAECVTDDLAKVDGFMEYYLDGILSDAAGTCGLEVLRRIVGVAKVAELTKLEDAKRAEMERELLGLAKKFIMNRAEVKTGTTYVNYVKGIFN